MNFTHPMPLWARIWNGAVFGLADVLGIAWDFRFSILLSLVILYFMTGLMD